MLLNAELPYNVGVMQQRSRDSFPLACDLFLPLQHGTTANNGHGQERLWPFCFCHNR
jgi:hypothetical protein